MVQSLLRKGAYRGQRVYRAEDGLVRVELEGGDRTILPVIYWALAFKEAHDSIWAGHLRGPPTSERLQRMYWWPRMREAVQSWVAACQDCGSRKAKPKAVVPPLRSVRTGDVCDRWAIDVAGPLPVTAGGNRYVIAAVEYTTRYAVATAVSEHTAKAIARFLMDKVVSVYGPMREIMMDGAMEFGSKATAELLELMQVKQSTPVSYRPKLLGLVERFHRTWKDIVSLYVDEGQDDWDDFLPSALYAYNSSRHSTHGFQPNELMMGRKLRTPAELLRRSRVTHPHSTLQEYHEVLLQDLSKARELAAVALQKEQRSTRDRPRDFADEPRLVVPKALQADILHFAHEDYQGGHQGKTRTHERLRSEFYWPGMYADVDRFVEECVDCASGKGRPPNPGPSPGNITPRRPFEAV
ncbi:hypothetical protein PR003_g27755, partial [Phytophthora rubi]